jgi:predicted alpha/beta superfamily hydrolase
MKLDKFILPTPSLGNDHEIRVYYPTNLLKRYPVLYVNDGAFAFRKDTPQDYECLSLDKAMEMNHQEFIVVTIAAKEWTKRTKEYSPFAWIGDAEKYLHPGEEEGAIYTKWIVETLMPHINQHYQALSDYSHNAFLGSSLGALIAIYTSSAYPHAFSKVGCFSFASWGNEKAVIDFLNSHPPLPTTSYFVRVGLEEGIPRDLTSLGSCYPALSKNLVSTLKECGVLSINYHENEGYHHKTKDWEKDMPAFLKWLDF